MKPPLVEFARLQDLSADFYAGKSSRDDFRSAVIDVIIGRLRCSRVSVWRFDGDPGALTLLCVASKVAGGELVATERRLLESEYHDYFDALMTTGTYVSVDAMTDLNLQPMREHYLLANRVRSMLDAAITLNGRAYGTVCCEQTDAIRRWQADEIADLRALVARFALLMASADDPALWGAPSVPLSDLRARS